MRSKLRESLTKSKELVNETRLRVVLYSRYYNEKSLTIVTRLDLIVFVDLTLPITSYFNGYSFSTAIRQVFRNRKIEDFWLNYCMVFTLLH